MELYTWVFLIQLVFPNQTVQDFKAEAESQKACLEMAADILKHDPSEFKAVSIGAACVKKKAPQNPA